MTSSPPDFTDNITQYRQLVETWSAITNIPRDKQGGVLLISLKGKPLQYCLALSSYQQNQYQRPQQDPRRSDPKNWMCLNCLFYSNFSHRTICLICGKMKEVSDPVGEQRRPRTTRQQFAQPQRFSQPQQYSQPRQIPYQQPQRFFQPYQQRFAHAGTPALYSQNYNQYYPQRDDNTEIF